MSNMRESIPEVTSAKVVSVTGREKLPVNLIRMPAV